jgi:hypothetical protein
MEKLYSVKPKRLLFAIGGVGAWFAAVYLLSGGGVLSDTLGFYLAIAGPATSVGAILGHPVVGLVCGTTSVAAFMALTLLLRS